MLQSLLKHFLKKEHVKVLGILNLKFSTSITKFSEKNVVASKVPSIDIHPRSLNDYIWKDLDKWHDKTAIVCAETGRSYTYSNLYKRTKILTNFLCKFDGLKSGDTVAVILPNVPEFPIILLSAIQAGYKVTTINPVYTVDEIAKQFNDSQTKFAFTLTELWPKVDQAIRKSSENKIPVENAETPFEAIKINEIFDAGDYTEVLPQRNNWEDVIILPYSSGTTGHPKGVELTMKNIVSVLDQLNVPEFRAHFNAEGSYQDAIPAVLPMFHIFGMVVVTLNLLSSGCKLITVPKFNPTIFAEVLEKHRPTLAYIVPPIVHLLSNNPNITSDHISTLRTVLCGGAPLGAADTERFLEKTKGKVSLLQGYGLTETSPTTHQQTELIKNGIKLGGCGFPLSNIECKIVSVEDEVDKKGLGPNESGELLIRGPQVMKGYHNNPTATKNVLDNDGWFRTGDIAHYDEDGHFFITDRLKELIKVKGFQVAPAELEELLRDYSEIEDAAVIGVPHKEFGEVPKAFVVPKNGVQINVFKVQEYISSKVAKYKQLIGGLIVVDAIPKSPSGKILRRQLKEL